MPNGDGADGAGPGPGEERAGSAAAKQRDGGGAGNGAVRRSQRPLGSPPGPSPRIRLALSRGQAITIPASWRGKGALRGSAVGRVYRAGGAARLESTRGTTFWTPAPCRRLMLAVVVVTVVTVAIVTDDGGDDSDGGDDGDDDGGDDHNPEKEDANLPHSGSYKPRGNVVSGVQSPL